MSNQNDCIKLEFGKLRAHITGRVAVLGTLFVIAMLLFYIFSGTVEFHSDKKVSLNINTENILRQKDNKKNSGNTPGISER
jgi:Zn-dependent membrane protease YugP